MNLKPLVIFVTAALLTVACVSDPLPEPTGSQELNGFSVPPPGGWGTEPWVCAGAVGSHPAWIPTNNPWPMNTTNSWCQWMPASTAGIFPYHVWSCDTTVTHNGSMQLYSGSNYTGDCALVWGGDTAHPLDAYWYDADLVEVNGWHSIWTPVGGTQQFVGIKSVKFGPYTSAQLCMGPLTGSAGSPCNAYTSMGVGTGPISVGYPNLLQSNGLFFETAAFAIQALR